MLYTQETPEISGSCQLYTYARARHSRLDGTHCPAWLRLLSGCAQKSRIRLTAILRRSCPSHAGTSAPASLRRQHHERRLRVYAGGEPASTHSPEARAHVQRVKFMCLMNARPVGRIENARPLRRCPLTINLDQRMSFLEGPGSMSSATSCSRFSPWSRSPSA